MARNSSAPDDRTGDRGRRDLEHLGRPLDETDSPQTIARQAIYDLAANGAKILYHPPSGALPASFHYELSAGGDRGRCRAIVAEVRQQPSVWAAVLREIAARAA